MIYDEKIFQSLFDVKVLEIINFKNNEFEKYTKEIFLNEIIGNKNQSGTKFIVTKDIKEKKINAKFKNIFGEELKYSFENNFKNINAENKVFLILTLGSSKIGDINNIISRLISLNKKLSGAIIIKNY